MSFALVLVPTYEVYTETMGQNYLYGFVDPQLTQEGNKFDDTQAYVIKCFQRRKEIYCVPYVAR